MDLLMAIVQWEAISIVGLFAIFVTARLLMGSISAQGLLETVRDDGGREASPERVQLLLATVGAAFTYARQVFGDPTVHDLPDISPAWLAILSGSHVLYLGRKYWLLNRAR